jgi:histidinol-phosphate aminotransferase
MRPKPHIVDLPVYQPGKPIEEVKRELGLDEVIKLASNENPYGSSSLVAEAIQAELSQLSLYPDGSSAELTTVLGEHLGVERNQIIFGCGSDEVIALITRAFILPQDESIMADQTFSVYKTNVDIEGGISIEVPLKDGVHDLDAMLAAVTDHTKIIWICNPNNPTGTIVEHDNLISFLNQVPSHVLVVLDEAYCEFVTDENYSDGISLLNQYPNLVALRTFSKIYGLASLRIGYAVASAQTITYINQVREPFNTSRIAQAAAKAALTDYDFVEACRTKNQQGIEYLCGQFDELGLSYFPANGNFIFVNIESSGLEMFQSLLKQGIIIRAGFGKYPNYIRVSVGTPEQNEKFITALKLALAHAQILNK